MASRASSGPWPANSSTLNSPFSFSFPSLHHITEYHRNTSFHTARSFPLASSSVPWNTQSRTRSLGKLLEWDEIATRKAQGEQRPENAGRYPAGEPAQADGSQRRIDGAKRRVLPFGGPPW